jgi:hypothetical protein
MCLQKVSAETGFVSWERWLVWKECVLSDLTCNDHKGIKEKASWETEQGIKFEMFHLICVRDWCVEDMCTYDKQVKHWWPWLALVFQNWFLWLYWHLCYIDIWVTLVIMLHWYLCHYDSCYITVGFSTICITTCNANF